MFFFTNIRFNY